MSYILDALRRANSERERGHVPTLNTNPGPADLSIDEDEELRPAARPAAAGASPLLIGGVVVIAAAAAGAAWFLRGEDKKPAPREVIVMPAPSPAPAPPAMPAPAPTTVATVPLTVPPRVEPAPAPTPAPPAAAAAPAPTPTREQLPAALRQQLPPLTTSGAMYSDTPANRMVIINGQLLHEGDKVTPELVLEQIQLKAAVLSFRGQRFTISY